VLIVSGVSLKHPARKRAERPPRTLICNFPRILHLQKSAKLMPGSEISRRLCRATACFGHRRSAVDARRRIPYTRTSVAVDAAAHSCSPLSRIPNRWTAGRNRGLAGRSPL